MNKFFIEVLHEDALHEDGLLSVVGGNGSGDGEGCSPYFSCPQLSCPILTSCDCYGFNLQPPKCPKLSNVEV